MTVEMSQNRGKRMEAENKKTQERFTKDLQELKSKQTEMNNILKRSEVAQSCLTLCNPMDCSLPGSSVHGIFQARILEWVARSQRQNNWSRRTDKWPGGQNGGNHCCRTEYRKRTKRNKDSLRDLWDNIKCTNIHIKEVQEGKERKDLRKYLKR